MKKELIGYYRGFVFRGFEIAKNGTMTLSIHYCCTDIAGIKGYKKIYKTRSGKYVNINGKRCYIGGV